MIFDREFQEEIVSALTDIGFMSEAYPYLDPASFDADLRDTVEVAIRHYKKYRQPPTLAQIRQGLRTAGKPVDIPAKPRSVRPHIDAVRKFAVVMQTRRMIAEAQNLLDVGNIDGVRRLMGRSLRATSVNGTAEGLITYYDPPKEERDRANICPTLVPGLDDLLGGGLAAGELGTVLAPTNEGKSSLLVWLGGSALLMGKRVVHFTLEMSGTQVARRYDQRLFGLRTEDMVRLGWKKIRRKRKEHFRRYKGALMIHEFSTRSVSVAAMLAVVDKYNAEQKVDLVIVDYGDLAKPSNPNDDYRLRLAEIWAELRAMAGIAKAPVWTASPANRPSYGKARIESSDVGECIQKAEISDVLLSINHLEATEPDNAILHVAKNRIGRAGDDLLVSFDLETAQIGEV